MSLGNQRRPQNSLTCPGAVDDNDFVMVTTVEARYQMETNRPKLTLDELNLALGLLRDDILQSLVNQHCPQDGQRNRLRPVGSTNLRSPSGLQALSVHAGVATLQGDCSPYQFDSLSCHVFANDIVLMFDSGTTQRDLEEGVKRTIESFMRHNFYSNAINLRLVEESSSLHITNLRFLNVQEDNERQAAGQLPTTPQQPREEEETATMVPTTTSTIEQEVLTSIEELQNTPMTFVGNNLQDSNMQVVSNNDENNNYLTIFFGVLAGVLMVILFSLLKYRREESKEASRKKRSRKGGSIGTKTSHEEEEGNRNDNTLLTGDESLTLEDDSTLAERSAETAPEEAEEENQEQEQLMRSSPTGTVSSNERASPTANSNASPAVVSASSESNQHSAYLEEGYDNADLTFFVEVGTEEVLKDLEDTLSSQPPPAALLQTVPEAPPSPPSPPPQRVSVKCGNASCKSCSRADDDDPNHLCPNYAAPWNTSGNDDPVFLRVFEEESVYHDKADDSTSSVVPPSQVPRTRTAPVSVRHRAYQPRRSQSARTSYSMPKNSLLASQSDASHLNKVVVVPPSNTGTSSSSPFHKQRSMGPAKTVQL